MNSIVKTSSGVGKDLASKSDDTKSAGPYAEMNRHRQLDAAQKAAATAAFIAGSKSKQIQNAGMFQGGAGGGGGGGGAKTSKTSSPAAEQGAQPNVSHEDKIQGMKDAVDARHKKTNADVAQATRAQVAQFLAKGSSEVSASESAQANKALANSKSHGAALNARLTQVASGRGREHEPPTPQL